MRIYSKNVFGFIYAAVKYRHSCALNQTNNLFRHIEMDVLDFDNINRASSAGHLVSDISEALIRVGAQKIEKKIYCYFICTRIGRTGRLSDAVYGMYCFLRLCWRVKASAFGLSHAQLVLIDVNRNFDLMRDTRYCASICFLRPLLHFIEDECSWIWFTFMA